jgi:plastocyanin
MRTLSREEPMRLRRLVAAPGLAAAAACGGGSSPTSGSTGGPRVTIQDFSFSPTTLTIKTGTTVTWTNNGPSAHTTTSDTMTWDSPTLSGPSSGDPYGGGMPAGTFQFTFNTPGTYRYHCSNHPPALYAGFTGTITVTP